MDGTIENQWTDVDIICNIFNHWKKTVLPQGKMMTKVMCYWISCPGLRLIFKLIGSHLTDDLQILSQNLSIEGHLNPYFSFRNLTSLIEILNQSIWSNWSVWHKYDIFLWVSRSVWNVEILAPVSIIGWAGLHFIVLSYHPPTNQYFSRTTNSATNNSQQ